MDLEAEIERADLIAEALRSHARLGSIEAEYHAKLKEYGGKAASAFDGERFALKESHAEEIAAFTRQCAYLEKARDLAERRYAALARRLKRLKAGAPRKKRAARRKK